MAYSIPAGVKIIVKGGSVGGTVTGAGTLRFEGSNDSTKEVKINDTFNISDVNLEFEDDVTLSRKNSSSTDVLKMSNVSSLDMEKLNVDAGLILDGTTAEKTTEDDEFNVKSNGKLLANGSLNAKITTSSGASIGVYGDGSILYLNNPNNSFYSTTNVYQSTGTGYLSVNHSVENLSVATNNNVRIIQPGAGITSFTATINEQTATFSTTKTDATKSVIIEKKSGSSWVCVGTNLTSVSVAGDESRIVFRAWDGSNFIEASPCQRTYYLINESGGSFTNASDWALNKSLSIVCTNAPVIAGNIFDCRHAK